MVRIDETTIPTTWKGSEQIYFGNLIKVDLTKFIGENDPSDEELIQGARKKVEIRKINEEIIIKGVDI